MKIKSRKQKQALYEEKYSMIPRDYHERLSWMYDEYNINERKQQEILAKRDAMLDNLYYTDIVIVLYEEPEGAPRPRFRLINRKNFVNEAMNNGSFVHVFQPYAKEDSVYMKRMLGQELYDLNSIIWSPCIVEIDMYQKTPTALNSIDRILSEIGIERPVNKPDWDNAGKKYTDMFNANLWLDDTLVIRGTVNKYNSILPRVEIKVRFLNTLYNKYQYNSTIKKLDDASEVTYHGKTRIE